VPDQLLSPDILTTSLWPQGDIRDPLGVWGFRQGATGSLAGEIKVVASAPEKEAAAYIFACYSLTYAQLTGAIDTGARVKTRLLAGWPNIDSQAGVQGYATLGISSTIGLNDFTAPVQGVAGTGGMVSGNQRFVLLFDPRPLATAVPLVELAVAVQVDGATYSFEGWGYYWDRSVLQAPGGPRHPGSN